MWQALLAAAAAGSGFFVKRICDLNAPESAQHTDQMCDLPSKLPTQKSSNTQISPPPPGDYSSHNTEIQGSTPCEESIFRFSSASGSPRARNLRKKLSCGSRGIRRMVEGNENVGREKFENNCGNLKVGAEVVLVDQRKIGKRFAICLKKKKRRTSKYTSAECESCAPKDDSSFAWGLGIGLMYMMSAGNSEVRRLNTAIDETAKVVQDLKTEIGKRKSRNLDVLSLRAEENANTKLSRGKYSRPKFNKTSTDNTYDSFPLSDEGECGSSVLTEEPQAEVLMDQLEAELESELQKLPWFTTEASGPKRSSDFFETEVSDEEFSKLDGQNLKSYQHIGVMPSELDQKLCYVLLEKQDSQIVELESELQKSHSKLNEKEAELQTLKECIRRLTEVSLASASDEEAEAHDNEEKKSDLAHDSKVAESNKSVIGI